MKLITLLSVTTLCSSLVLSSNAATHDYFATLSGENPQFPSSGTGAGTFVYNDSLHTLAINITFSGLTGTTTAAHIHAPTTAPFTGTVGVATQLPTFENLPIGVTAGSFSQTLDLTLASSYNPTFITANGGTPASAEAALFAAIDAGKSYINIHTTYAASGEIRGFLVPEVAMTLPLFGFATAGLLLARRRFSA